MHLFESGHGLGTITEGFIFTQVVLKAEEATKNKVETAFGDTLYICGLSWGGGCWLCGIMVDPGNLVPRK